MKKIVSPYWFKIKGKWYQCVTVIKNNEMQHYVNGEYSHSVEINKSSL